MGGEGAPAGGEGGEPAGRRLFPCDGYSRGPRFIWRLLFFVGAAVTLEFTVWIAVSVPKMSPGGIEAFIIQLTWVSGLVMGAASFGLAGIIGLAFALGPPAGKDSYCHMAMRGFQLGSIVCAVVFGVKIAFF